VKERERNMNKLLAVVIIGIIVLGGLGAGVSGTTQQQKKSHPNETSGTTYVDELDQSMTTPDGVIQVGWYPPAQNTTTNLSVAQSFKPQKELLTRVQFLMGRNATTTNSCVLAIRDNLTHNDLASVHMNPAEFPVMDPAHMENLTWVTFDVNDIWVTLNQTYYIVLYTANDTDNDDNYYYVSGNGTNLYPNGTAYLSTNNGDTWQEITNSDGCFKTYGLRETFLDLTVKSSLFGPMFIIRNIGNYTAWDVTWNFTINGGIFRITHWTVVGTLPKLEPGDEIIVKMDSPIIGFGAVTLSIRVSAANAREISAKINAMILFIFWIVK
jgi:hypothetical protein